MTMGKTKFLKIKNKESYLQGYDEGYKEGIQSGMKLTFKQIKKELKPYGLGIFPKKDKRK